jgi:hypothetical protein
MKLLAPRNLTSVKIDDQLFEPDSEGSLVIDDNTPAGIVEDLRSHGFTDVPGRVHYADDPEVKLHSAMTRNAELEQRLAQAQADNADLANQLANATAPQSADATVVKSKKDA